MSGPIAPRSDADLHALLGIYLNDHLAGATAGTQLAHRAASGHAGTALEDELQRLAREIEDDRASLVGLMRALGVPIRHYKVYAASVGELLGRLKPNGRLVERSPLSSLVELDAMRVGIEGKAACWRALLRLAQRDDRLDRAQLEALGDRARQQADRVEALRDRVLDAFVGA
jgi:hypothetical protein